MPDAQPALDPVLYESPARDAPSHHGRSLPLRVGTRGSPLALTQTRLFLSLLTRFCPVLAPGYSDEQVFQQHVIRTTGDRVQDRSLADIGGKGLFSKEIHEALLDGRIDFAVHSLKDLETEMPPGAVIGTNSLRRQAQVLHARPDLRMELLRGNVQPRIAKVMRGDCTASLLALAGLRRLGLENEAVLPLDPDAMVPSAGQGIVGITVRRDDTVLRELLAGIEDPEARAVSTAERSLLASLDGSCRTPIGGHARLLPAPTGQVPRLRLTGLVARADGSFLLKRGIHGSADDAARLGAELGASLRADSPRDIFA